MGSDGPTAGFRTELPVAGRPVLVVGGGPEALGPIAALRGAGASVSVVATRTTDAVTDLAERDLITLHRRSFTSADASAAWLVVAATGDPQQDADVQRAAAGERRFCVPGTRTWDADRTGDGTDTGTYVGVGTSAGTSAGTSTETGAGTSSGTGAGTSTASSAGTSTETGAGLGTGTDTGTGATTGSGIGTGTEVGRQTGTIPRLADEPSRPPVGRVILVGGGPGDPGLMTMRGMAALRRADVVVTDRLAPLAALEQVRAGTEIIDVAKIPRGHFTPQEEINAVLVDRARTGKTVVRLKGGDIFVFGRGGEEWQACAEAGIPVELIPGVSSAIAAPALAGIPVTHRALAQGFTVVSGHVPPGDPGSTLDWAALARSGTTLIILMGVRNLTAICAALIEHGLDPGTPAATVADAGMPGQRSVRGSLREIAAVTEAGGIGAPAVTVIGAVAGFEV